MALLIAVALLSGCSWFGAKRHEMPNPTELVITGAPTGSMVYIDGVPSGATNSAGGHPQVLRVAAGSHQVEIHVGDKVVYREDAYVDSGQRTVVTVLSGFTR